MKRQIKFRAWDKEIDGMFYPDGETIYEIIRASGECIDECWLLNTKHVLMQFTGFKDVHGKEIYEHDAVRTTANSKLEAVVFWNEEAGAWNFAAYIRQEGKDFPDLRTGMFSDFHDPEIIGNIYDNKEFKEYIPLMDEEDKQ